MKKYITIDIGGTAIKYGLITQDGQIIYKNEIPTEAHLGGRTLMEKVRGLIEKLSAKNTLSGICISTAGMVDPKKGEIIFSGPQIPDYVGVKYKSDFEAYFGIPCEVENDVNCAGLAECYSGAGEGADNMIMLTIGTGIGGCLIIDRKIYHGFGNRAFEVGYFKVYGEQFQNLGSATALCEYVADKKGDTVSNWNGKHIFECAKENDPICVQAIDRMADVLGEGIANLCCVVDPEVVVLGGGVMAQEEYLRPKLEKAIADKMHSGIAVDMRLEFAQNQNDAGMLGAFYNFLNRQ